ncbi:hypothetical protein [Staphylococcus haemolyticus]|nr:hypothetical protein [Staphylococcus haemolyticus]
MGMLGEMLMGVMIDDLGLGVGKNARTVRKFSGVIGIGIGIILLGVF